MTAVRSTAASAGLKVVGGRSPSERPPFTLAEMKKTIPRHCFERTLLRSFSFLIYDLVVVSCLVYSTTWFSHPSIPSITRWGLLWPLYWFFSGAHATGIWVISHECGHGAFADSPAVNDAVGFIFHSALLVPYYSWKHSHRRHHSNTGNLSRDEVFVPTWKEAATEEFSWGQLAFVRVIHLFLTLTLGWPLYLMFNAAGRPYPRWANHFNPYSPIFSPKERLEVLASDVGVSLVIAGLVCLGRTYGWLWLLRLYGIPYLFVNFWLVLITLLQHTHPALPHYLDEEWDWLRGALTTVDRDFGFLNTIFHNITDTHVVHHLFSKMPHYHAMEATKAIREVLGPYYKRDGRNLLSATWQDWKTCRYVAPDVAGQSVMWYRS